MDYHPSPTLVPLGLGFCAPWLYSFGVRRGAGSREWVHSGQETSGKQGLGLRGHLDSSREEGLERKAQRWVWSWETKSTSFLLRISVSHQRPQRVRVQQPFGSFQTFTWATLLSGMPSLHRSKVYPSAASGLKGWGLGPWTAGRDEPLGSRPALHSSLQGLAALGALRLLLLLDV